MFDSFFVVRSHPFVRRSGGRRLMPPAVVAAAVVLALSVTMFSGGVVGASQENELPIVAAEQADPTGPGDISDGPQPSPSPDPPAPQEPGDVTSEPEPSPSPAPDPDEELPIDSGEGGDNSEIYIDVTKAGCEPGMDKGLSLDELIASCTLDGAGYVFHLMIHGNDYAQDTVKHNNSTQGFASWVNTPGDFAIVEDVPPMVSDVVIYCQVTTADGKAWGYNQMVGEFGVAVSNLDAGSFLHCYFFNVTAEPDQQVGRLVVYKYLCQTDQINIQLCDPYDADFSLTPENVPGNPIHFSTGADGFAAFGLPDGTYWRLEEIGEEWCFIDSPDFTEGGTLPVISDHETVVHVFNCGNDGPGDEPGDEPSGNEPGDEPGDYVVTTFPNTGSGVAAGAVSNGRPGGLLLAAGVLLATVVWGVGGAQATRRRR